MIQKKVTKKVMAKKAMKENEMKVDEGEIWRSAGVIIVFLYLKDFNSNFAGAEWRMLATGSKLDDTERQDIWLRSQQGGHWGVSLCWSGAASELDFIEQVHRAN